MHVEKQILELGGSTDQATREMLQSVLNKKESTTGIKRTVLNGRCLHYLAV